ncbi:unnamed protein product [Protopolystoma xenopodis]|uniref:Uncharacterized protein n=1 Tax=Protopolystoma xenopodis TaxID=117903 RepID=A0A3S5ADS6_9PLAT|nr:unnamed protein product [Protopolystoma xenopodis]
MFIGYSAVPPCSVTDWWDNLGQSTWHWATRQLHDTKLSTPKKSIILLSDKSVCSQFWSLNCPGVNLGGEGLGGKVQNNCYTGHLSPLSINFQSCYLQSKWLWTCDEALGKSSEKGSIRLVSFDARLVGRLSDQIQARNFVMKNPTAGVAHSAPAPSACIGLSLSHDQPSPPSSFGQQPQSPGAKGTEENRANSRELQLEQMKGEVATVCSRATSVMRTSMGLAGLQVSLKNALIGLLPNQRDSHVTLPVAGSDVGNGEMTEKTSENGKDSRTGVQWHNQRADQSTFDSECGHKQVVCSRGTTLSRWEVPKMYIPSRHSKFTICSIHDILSNERLKAKDSMANSLWNQDQG